MRALLRSPQAGPNPLIAATRRRGHLDFAWHYHQQFELVLIVEGAGVRHVGDSISEYVAGDLVLLGPGLPHGYTSEAKGGQALEYVVVHFDPQLFGPRAREEPTLRDLNATILEADRGIAFQGLARTAASSLILGMPQQDTLSCWSALLSVFGALSCARDRHVLSSATFVRGAGNEADERPLNRACRFIQQHLASPVTLADVAAAAGMSPSNFTRFFRRSTGRTLTDYVNEMRVRRACLLLLESDRPIKDVAAAAGFSGLSYFHRRFVRSRGVTPSDYRRAAQSAPQPGGVPVNSSDP